MKIFKMTCAAALVLALGNPAATLAATATTVATTTTTTAPAFNIDQALTDRAQSTTLAFSGFGMLTGNLGAQTFFPPGKVADYTGFQYLRDNDPSNMGHNTSFLTRISSNVLYILNDTQLAQLKALAKSQVANINLYGWKRYPLMKAFRRLLDNDLPSGATGLSLSAVKAASKDMYLLDGQISYERAVVYADIYRSLTTTQKAYLDAMVGKGYGGWPDKVEDDVRSKTSGLINDEVVAMMTYAGDLYSWYAGSITADVYFCPERHGTYFGSFFIKDAPAVGHPGYSIDETMTAVVGSALVDSTQGYISSAGATKMNALVTLQKQNLYANTSANIVLARTKISEALRSLISTTAPTTATLASVKATVDTYSGMYGELDGENNYNYASTFATVFNNVGGTYITSTQKTALAAMRKKYMTASYADGTTIDFSAYSKYYLYAAEVQPTSSDFISYTSAAVTDPLFTGATVTTTSATTSTTVGSTPTTTLSGLSLSLASGWNLVGNSTNSPVTVATTFGSSSYVTSVWKWVAASSKWAFYAPGQSDGGAAYAASSGYELLITVNGGEGFWVNAKAGFTAQMPTGTAVTSASMASLSSGWNLIAVGDNPTPSSFNSTLSSASSATSTPPSPGTTIASVSTLWAWDTSKSKWYFYAPSLQAQGGTVLADYISNKGYLDFTAGGKTLSTGMGIWVNKL